MTDRELVEELASLATSRLEEMVTRGVATRVRLVDVDSADGRVWLEFCVDVSSREASPFDVDEEGP